MTSSAACHVESIDIDDEQAHTVFDEIARQSMGMPGSEFLRRWDAGEWADTDIDSVDGLVDVRMALALVR